MIILYPLYCDNYQAPSFDDLKGGVNVFGNMVPKPSSSDMREVAEGELKAPGEDEQVILNPV